MAADLGIIQDPEVWFKFLDYRNLTTHIYNEDQAEEVFSHLPSFVSEVEKLISKIETEDK